ncbi:MAG: hypothetical protein NTU62_05305 [Spirochaetes bacterium]|nr:hypothetical protein [Spirochaetota bacterium]
MRPMRLATALLAIVALAGCMDTSTKITVKPDGSGTIEKTIVLSSHLAEFAQSMGMKMDRASLEQGMLNEEGLRTEAAQMGTGVAFVSAQKITTAKGNGYRALYSFTDITKLKINRNPVGDVAMPTGGTGGGAASGGAGGSGGQQSVPEYLTFSFAKGTPAVLTIVEPKVQRSTTGASSGQAAADPAQLAALKPLYSDLRIALSIEVQGKITETNAAFVSGSTVTLMDMDFGVILADDATVKKLSALPTQSLAEVEALVKSLPGVKLDTQESVKIAFK